MIVLKTLPFSNYCYEYSLYTGVSCKNEFISHKENKNKIINEISTFHSGYRYTGTLANSADPEEMAPMRHFIRYSLFAKINTVIRV